MTEYGKPSVLMVVEDLLIGDDLADTLESLGYSIDQILLSFEEALSDSFKTDADVVVVDLEVKDGVDPIAAGLVIGERSGRPVMFLTDDANQAERVGRLGEGAPHVMWPFLPQVLGATLKELLRRTQHLTPPSVHEYVGGSR